MFSSAGIGAFSGIMVAGRLSPGRRLGWVIPGGSGIVFCDHAGGVELAFTGARNGAGCAGLLLERIFQHFVDKRRTATCSRGHSGPGDGRIRNLTELRCAGWAVDGHYGEFDGHACGNDGWAYDHPSADRHDLCDATTSPKLARRSSPWRVTNFGFAYRLEFDGHDL